jgi:hypothetical protein
MTFSEETTYYAFHHAVLSSCNFLHSLGSNILYNIVVKYTLKLTLAYIKVISQKTVFVLSNNEARRYIHLGSHALSLRSYKRGIEGAVNARFRML